MNQENKAKIETTVTHRLAMIFLAGGALICFLATIDSLGAIPFPMPRSWYINREIWIGIGIAGLVSGFLLQRPEKGNEYDTT